MALDILHHHVDRAVACCTEIVNSDRVWVTKASRRLSFPAKPSQPFGVGAHFGWKNLDRDAITKEDVARAINRAHTALAQHRFDLILTVEHRINY